MFLDVDVKSRNHTEFSIFGLTLGSTTPKAATLHLKQNIKNRCELEMSRIKHKGLLCKSGQNICNVKTKMNFYFCISFLDLPLNQEFPSDTSESRRLSTALSNVCRSSQNQAFLCLHLSLSQQKMCLWTDDNFCSLF